MIPRIFNQRRRMAKFKRAEDIWQTTGKMPWLVNRIADDLVDRLEFVPRRFQNALLIGDLANAVSHRLLHIPRTRFDFEAMADDILPYKKNEFDLVLAPGLLDTVNDLPGLLVQIRHILEPGGLFIAALPGGGTLPLLRQKMLQLSADEWLRPIARTHPQIDVRNAGDLMARAGFALPVADLDVCNKTYARGSDYLADLRQHSFGNALDEVYHLARSEAAALNKAIESSALTEQFLTVMLTGWAPQSGDPVQEGPKGLSRL